MTYNVFSGTLNPIHSLTLIMHWLWIDKFSSALTFIVCFRLLQVTANWWIFCYIVERRRTFFGPVENCITATSFQECSIFSTPIDKHILGLYLKQLPIGKDFLKDWRAHFWFVLWFLFVIYLCLAAWSMVMGPNCLESVGRWRKQEIHWLIPLVGIRKPIRPHKNFAQVTCNDLSEAS